MRTSFENFINDPAGALMALFIGGMICWAIGLTCIGLILPALWEWFDDGDSIKNFDTTRNWMVLSTVSFSPILLFLMYLMYLFPYVALSLAILVIMAFLARTGWRLKKKFGKHIVNFRLHKKPRE